ncbi:hypothetical protein RFI_34299, partial [Reticulomyxa filosa]
KNEFKKKIYLSPLYASLFIGSLGIRFLFFFIELPTSFDKKQYTDAIIILTGGKNRIENGFSLFKNNNAKKLLISGVGMGVKIEDFTKLMDKYEIEKDQVVLGSIAQNTLENALEAKIFMELHNYKSLYLVTSSYHTPRSKLIFERLMPNIEINAVPVFSNNFHQEYRYSSIFALGLAFVEYNKYLATLFNNFVDDFDQHLIKKDQFVEAEEIVKKLLAALKEINGPSAGLAAPQIGINKAVFVYSFDRKYDNLEPVINPKYLPIEDKKIFGWEACYSTIRTSIIKIAYIGRFEKIEVKYLNVKGKIIKKILEGFAAK